MVTKDTVLTVLSSPHPVILAEAGNDYKLIYYCYMLDPKKSCYEFYGILPKSNEQRSLLYKSASLDNMLDYIEKTFPLMKIEDWQTLDELLNSAKFATQRCGYTHNEKTLKDEENAYKVLEEFCKKHGLW